MASVRVAGWKSKKELPRAEAGIESPYDIDARFRSRRGVNWVGYAVHLSESCEDEACHLITHVETTDAAIHEAQRTEVIHQSLADKHLLPSEHFVDAAYVSAEHLVSAEQRQIELMGPAHQNTSWQSRLKGGIDETQFAIDWSTKTVTCPKGKHSVSWKHFGRDTDDRIRIRAMFSSQDCLTCEYKVLCTKGAQRSVSFLPKEQYEALAKKRRRQANRHWRKRYQRRAGIEGTLSQGVRGFGLRRSRYRGLAKTHLQNVAIAAAINLDRLVNWFNGVPIARTRTSRFKALKAA